MSLASVLEPSPPAKGYEYKDVLIRLEDIGMSYGETKVLSKLSAEVRDIVRPGCVTGQVVGILGPSGVGKCLGRGTPILMYDGSIKNVEDILVGELLMGPDSKPRQVMALGRGVDELFKINPVKGEPFVTNSEHLLALHVARQHRSRARYQIISVIDYLAQSRTFKARAKLYRSGIDFPELAVPVDPYFFGLWLGDGDSDEPQINTIDQEVVEELSNIAQAAGAEVSHYQYGQKCPKYRIHQNHSGKGTGSFLRALRSTGAMHDKHIPHYFKVNCRKIRLQVLAGLIDSDGGKQNNCFDFINKNRSLSEDVCFLTRSLGLATYMSPCRKRSQTGHEGIYFRVCISGHTDQISTRILRKKASSRQQRKNVLHTGFSVTQLDAVNILALNSMVTAFFFLVTSLLRTTLSSRA